MNWVWLKGRAVWFTIKTIRVDEDPIFVRNSRLLAAPCSGFLMVLGAGRDVKIISTSFADGFPFQGSK